MVRHVPTLGKYYVVEHDQREENGDDVRHTQRIVGLFFNGEFVLRSINCSGLPKGTQAAHVPTSTCYGMGFAASCCGYRPLIDAAAAADNVSGTRSETGSRRHSGRRSPLGMAKSHEDAAPERKGSCEIRAAFSASWIL